MADPSARRNRVVSVRFTDREYQALQALVHERGESSLAGLVRSVAMDAFETHEQGSDAESERLTARRLKDLHHWLTVRNSGSRHAR